MNKADRIQLEANERKQRTALYMQIVLMDMLFAEAGITLSTSRLYHDMLRAWAEGYPLTTADKTVNYSGKPFDAVRMLRGIVKNLEGYRTRARRDDNWDDYLSYVGRLTEGDQRLREIEQHVYALRRGVAVEAVSA